MNDASKVDFAPNPRSGKKQFEWRIVRTPKKGKLEFVILSAKSLGCFTHFLDKRTQPHFKENCPCENTTMKLEYHSYVAAQEEGTLRKIVVEFTERVDGIVLEWLARHRTLRGCRMKMSRMGASHCGKIFVEIAEQAAELPEATKVADVQAIMFHIWKIQPLEAQAIEIHPPRIMEPQTSPHPAAAVLDSWEEKKVS